VKRRLPRAATARRAARIPPPGLPGLDPRWSRIVRVLEGGGRPTVDWHVLDNAAVLTEADITPVGTVLCVHGNPTWSYLWRSLLERATAQALAGGPAWRIIAVDHLEMGFSERTGARRTLPDRVEVLGRLTNALWLTGPVVTFGHDWGGVISLGWAIDHPDQLAGVMLLNTAVHQPADSPIPSPLRLALSPGVLGTATVTTPAFLETTLALAHPQLPRDVRNAYRAPYRTRTDRGGIGQFVADIPVYATDETAPELHRINQGIRTLDVPALMLWGPRDPVFGDRYLNDLISRMPHADVHRFEGAGHLLAEDVDIAAPALTWLDEKVRRRTRPGSAEARAEDARMEAPHESARNGVPYRPLWAALDEHSEHSAPALVELAPPVGDRPRVVSWRLLSRRVRELAAGLAWAGVKKGDRVSLLVPPGADLTAVLYACLRIGAVVVVADAGLGIRGLTRAVRGAWPDHVIGALPGLAAAKALGWPGRRISTVRLSPPARHALGVSHTLAELAGRGVGAKLPPEPSPQDAAAVLFTSGSTGPAKGVVYSHARLAALRDALAAQYDIRTGTGLVAGFAPFALLGPALGATSATPDMDVTKPATLTARATADAIDAVHGEVLFLSPAALANVVATARELDREQRETFRAVRTFLSAGAPVPEPLLAEAAMLFPNAEPHTPYGMTEGLLLTDISLDGIREATLDDDPIGGVCVGTPTASTRVRIAPLDAEGRPAGDLTEAPGVTGEIVVSAPHVKDAYDRLWLTDRASRRDSGPVERWHRTNDVGHLDHRGRLWVEGRLQHVLVTADGVRTPVGAEQRIERVPNVVRAAVVGVGPLGTQQAVAVLETVPAAPRPGLAEADLSAAVRQASPIPLAAVLVAPRLPTDIRHNSKIDRTRLAVWATRVLAGGRMTAP
jgi:acyl-coenzyme A synthetase/AMP-(fatty) acid ligase/pimeloyl-ACP methyl ester carboxylesterase